MITKTHPSLAFLSSVIALAVTAACSSEPGNLTSPSSIAPAAGTTHASGATVRYYAANAGGGPVAAGSLANTLSVTVTNCNGTGLCGTSTTSQNQAIGSATITVPAGFTVDASSLSTNATAGKLWSAAYSAGTITLLATKGTEKLDPGQSVTVTFKADAPCAGGSYTFNTGAYQDTTLPSSTSYGRIGSDASIFVSGNCATVCAQGLGYWKHATSWPVASLTLGTVSYTEAELRTILDQPSLGNGLVILAHQLISAKLNIANGVSDAPVASTITAADTLVGGLIIPPVGADSVAASAASGLASTLEVFNDGCANLP